MIVGDLDRFAIREDPVNAGHEDGPLALVVEVVHHQESAALEVLPQARRLGVAEDPVAHADRVEERPVEHLVARRCRTISSMERVWTRVRRRMACMKRRSDLLESVPQRAKRRK